MARPETRYYDFGSFRLDAAKHLLFRDGQLVPLPPKAAETLLVLVENHGQLVEKEELMRSVWPDCFVEEANVAVHISQLRKTLGDNNGNDYIETIPRRGYRFVGEVRLGTPDIGGLEAVLTPAVAAEPAPTSAETLDLGSNLTGGGKAPGTRFSARALVALGTAVSLCAVTLVVGYRLRSKAEAAARARRSVAVLGFSNLSGRPDEAWLSTAISEMLTTELAAGQKLRMIPGENVARMKINLSLPDADSYGQQTLAEIHKNLNADDIVLGSYIPLGKGQIRLDLRLQDTQGEILAAVSEKGSEEQIDDLVTRAGAELREKLGVGAVSMAEAAVVRATLPSNREAAQLYSEGLAKMRSFDNLGARDAFEKAIATEPNFALSHSALAAALANLGYDAKAREEAKRAFDLSASLGSEERLWIEGHYREMADELDKAVETYRKLFQLFPDNLEYGLRLAHAQYHAARGQDTLATVGALRRLAAPARDDPRIDVMEADAYFLLGDYKRYQGVAARAAEKAEAAGARLLEAEALADDCWGLKVLGQPKEAMATCEKARQIFTEAGDRAFAAAVLNQIAVVLQEQGDFAAAKSKLDEALSISREVGDRDSTAAELGNLAAILHSQGDVGGAKTMYGQVVGIYKENGDEEGASIALGDIGGVLVDMGDVSGARAKLQESLALARESGNKGQEAVDSSSLGEVLYLQGDLAGARNLLEPAELVLGQTGDKKDDAYALWVWGRVLSAQGDLAGARKKYQEALHIRTEAGEKEEVAQSQVALADLTIEEGHPTDAETPCRSAIEEFRAEKARDVEILAHAVLVRALLEMGTSPDLLKKAQKEVDAARPLAAKSQNVGIRLEMMIVAARVRAARGYSSEAEKSLRAALAESTKYGFVPYEFESRLALGQAETRSGKTAAGRARLASLGKDATAKGFALIARKAAAAADLPAPATPHDTKAN
jgi:DNA-binding winged helix-turn-helix (wHTH) protein/tetratricopeptide (TPR) repeat protein